MKKKLIKNLAVVLVALMLMPYALAAGSDGTITNSDGSLTGAGSYANLAGANVWKIKFPTIAGVLDFIVDPHKVVGSSGALESDATVAAGTTVLFKHVVNSSGRASEYSGTSSQLKVLNQGSTDVVVSLEVQLTDTKIAIHTANTSVNSDAKPSLKFTVTGTSNSDAVLGPAGVVMETPVARTNAAYIVKANTSNGTVTGYQYVITSDGSDNLNSDGYWQSATYTFSAEANTNSSVMDDWDDATLQAPSLVLKWVVRNRTVKTIAIDTPTIGEAEGFCKVSIKNGFAGQTGKVYVHLNDDFKMNDDAGVTMVYFFKNAEGNIEEKSERLALDKSGSPAVVTKVNNTYSFTFTMPSAAQWTDFEPDGTTPNRIRLVDVGGIEHI